MVLCWSPEPPQEFNDKVVNHSENIVVYASDESDEETNASDGYQLLTADETAVESDNEQNLLSDDNIDSNSSFQLFNFESSGSLASFPPITNLPPCDSSAECDLPPRNDIIVDTASVQAAMAGFTLPSSAIPSWASSVPESQWTEHLMSRISSLQNHRNNS